MKKGKQSSSPERWPTTLAEQARVFGYERVTSERDWEIERNLPAGGVRRLFLNAIGMAILEGYINHAHAIEARLPYLRSDFKCRLGRSKDGGQTMYVGR